MRRVLACVTAATSLGLQVLAAVAAVLLTSGCASCQSTVRETALPAVAAGGFDGAVADQAAHRLYLADGVNNQVDVVDISTATPRMAGTVALGAAPHGLAIAPDIHRLYAALTGGVLAVVDTSSGAPASMKIISRVTVDKTTADLVDYSATTHRVYVGTGFGGEVVAVDTATNAVENRLGAGTPVEQPRYDSADGMVYVSAPGKAAILQMNPATGKVTRSYSTGKCHPSGLAISPSRQLALSACGASVVMFNLRTGAREVNESVAGGDIVTYDSGSDRFAVASAHSESDSVIGVFNGDGGLIGSVTSAPIAHQAAFDDAHGLIYAPSAKGLMSLAPAACEPPPDWLKFAGGMAIYATPFMLAGIFLVVYARRRRARRHDARPSFDDMQKEDLAFERERMRAFEDSIFGPLNPDSPN